ncbi:MAG: V-type ATPase subunit [Synergistaceae bacterium]|jgi:V/A-type H+-transporting ATPase subunit C|nr:V-type ATPase subunit [Synergistaceae bacterium]
MSGEAYGYAVARIRAMEPLLFDASAYQRILDADGLDGALKVIGETSYARGMSGDDATERYDSALEAELLATYREFQLFVPDGALIDIFRVPYDFHNVKVILKSIFNSRSGGKKRWDLLTQLGSIPTDDLIVKIESEEYVLLPYGLSQTIPACVSVWDQTRDMVEVERLLDRGLFAAILNLAKSVDEPGVLKWAKARVDSENIRNLLRLKRFGFDAAATTPFLHDGGSLDPMTLVSLLPEPYDSWSRMLSYSGIGAVLSGVQDDGNFDNLIVALEKALDDFCQSELENARYNSNSSENVLAYLWGKEMEVKNIRTILVSKGTDSNRDEVRRLMRHGY